jgi:hypothetical protein
MPVLATTAPPISFLGIGAIDDGGHKGKVMRIETAEFMRRFLRYVSTERLSSYSVLQGRR